MAIDYAQWVRDALERKPHLNQSGLARHLGRHRAVITHMIQGKRAFKVTELAAIAAYLGEPVPGLAHGAAPALASVPFGGAIDRAWRLAEDVAADPGQTECLAGVPDVPPKHQAWYAVHAATPCKTMLAGDVVIAQQTASVDRPGWFILRREKSGLVNLSLHHAAANETATMSVGARDRSEIVGRVLEVRRRVG